MMISISTIDIIQRFGVEEGIALMKECGFDGMDLDLSYMMPMRPWTVLVPKEENRWEGMSDEELCLSLKPYKDAVERHGMRIGQAHGVYPCYFEVPESNLRQTAMLRRQIMLCGYLGCPRLVVHPGSLKYEIQMTGESAWEVHREQFSRLIPALKRHHVTLCLENVFLSYRDRIYEGVCSTADEINRYIDRLNEMAGERCFAFCLDTGHALLTGKDIGSLIRQVGSRLEALHLNDNDGREDLHMLPFTGKLDWERMCGALRDTGYGNSLNFELILRNFPKELYPQVLRYVSAAGRAMAGKMAAP